jgi:hypothetical protein
VLTRSTNHWSQRISSNNPRGFSDQQLQKIADAPTLEEQRKIELNFLFWRHKAEKDLKKPIEDEFGLDCIAGMLRDAKAEYAARICGEDVQAGSDDEEEEEEEEEEE